MATRLFVKRIYAPAAASDGYRVLVDRIWPRGLGKNKARIDRWLKEIAPGTKLRQWFGHEPAKWQEFQTRYAAELKTNANAMQALDEILRAHRVVTLLFGARDTEHNNAVALARYLLSR